MATLTAVTENSNTNYTGYFIVSSPTVSVGTMYWYVSLSATPPTAADLKSGAGSVTGQKSAARAATETQTLTSNGLDGGTTYYYHALYDDTVEDSLIVTSGPITTEPDTNISNSQISSIDATDLTLTFDADRSLASAGSIDWIIDTVANTNSIFGFQVGAGNNNSNSPALVAGQGLSVGTGTTLSTTAISTAGLTNGNTYVLAYRLTDDNGNGGKPESVTVQFVMEQGGDVTAPTFTSAVINAAGDTLTLTADEAVSVGAGGSGGFTLSTGQTVTYTSGAGSTTIVCSISPVAYAETVTYGYTQPGDGFEDAAGNDLATFSGAAVTNNSTNPAPVAGVRAVCRDKNNALIADGVVIDWGIAANAAGVLSGNILDNGSTAISAGGTGTLEITSGSIGAIGGTVSIVADLPNGQTIFKNNVPVVDVA